MKSVVILAPHASHPPMDGASYRSWSIAKELSHNSDTYYFAKHRFFHLSPGGAEEEIESVTLERGKHWSAVRTLMFSSHYLVEKHLPISWQKKAIAWIKKIDPELLYVNFLWTWNSQLQTVAPSRVCIDTHNYDPEWWSNLRRSSGNALSRRACDLSCTYALKTLDRLPSNVVLVHVTESDRERYLAKRPGLRQEVLPNGCDFEFRNDPPAYETPSKRLYFLGALNLQITLDALEHFAERFWPSLCSFAEMHVFGSGDAPKVEAMCGANGWSLHRGLPEADLSRQLERMHYLVLPFSYSAGSKLKLVNACGKGIPVVATQHGVSGFNSLPGTVFVAESSKDWAKKISTNEAPSDRDLAECRDFAKRFSWQHLVSESSLFR